MASPSPIREFLLPRVAALVDQAVATGAERDAVVAVLIDIVTAAPFDNAAPSPADDSVTRPGWDRSNTVVIAGAYPADTHVVGTQAEDDFIAPLTFRD